MEDQFIEFENGTVAKIENLKGSYRVTEYEDATCHPDEFVRSDEYETLEEVFFRLAHMA